MIGWDATQERALLAEAAPTISPEFALRSVALAVASTAVLVGFWLGSVQLVSEAPRVRAIATDERPAAAVAAVAVAAVAVAAAGLVWVSPQTLTKLVTEDGVVEWASALLCFAAAAMAGRAGLRFRSWPNRAAQICCAVLAGGWLLIGLEEVAYFQRQLGLETPNVVPADNGQRELNLHNLGTDVSETAYYLAAFLLCVALPAVVGDRHFTGFAGSLAPTMPGLMVLRSSVLASAIAYEMWDVAPVQVTFWGSLAALGLVHRRSDARIDRALAVVMMTLAASFVLGGARMTRSWDDTEPRKLVIPFGFAVYGYQLLRRAQCKG